MTDTSVTPPMGDGTGLDDAAYAIEMLSRPGRNADKPDTRTEPSADDDGNAEEASFEDEAGAQEADTESEQTPDDGEEGSDEEGSDAEAEDDEEAADEDADKPSEPLTPDAKTTVKVKLHGKEEVLDLQTVVNGFQFQAVTTQRAQALADERRSFEAERQQATRERDEYGQLIQALRTNLSEIERTVQEPDWQRLRAENPQEYLVQKDAWNEHREMKRIAQAEADRIEAEKSRETQVRLRQYAEHQKELALTANPAWKDATVWSKDRAAMIEVGRKVGLSDAELDKASVDHRVLLLLHKAAAHDRQQADRAKPAPRPKADPASPPVARPASKNLAPKPVSDVTRSKMRLAQTGRPEDAALVFEQMSAARAARNKKG